MIADPKNPLSSNDLIAIIDECFPADDDRDATFAAIASFIQRLKFALDAAGYPARQQRWYVLEALRLDVILGDKLAPRIETYSADPAAEAAEFHERIRHWIAVFWPEDD